MKDELPRLVGAQYPTGDKWRNNSRKNEETEPKQKQHPVVDVTGDRSKVRCCKEQYCIGGNDQNHPKGKRNARRQKERKKCKKAKWLSEEALQIAEKEEKKGQGRKGLSSN